jgi:hypothetical protein
MILLTQIIGLSCLTYLWINAEPAIILKRMAGFKEEDYVKYSLTKKYAHKLIYCALCSGFWIGILSGNLYVAAIVAVVSKYLDEKV